MRNRLPGVPAIVKRATNFVDSERVVLARAFVAQYGM
ncbi:hypothetical protein FHX42_001348 [Saccharopolyspora lacisalsi]|uniref:Uncharacterized protein n=1 Tax=Halosaccharopolyspora lacisalsi TaxID=1000566 RepID=A0A839DTE0_9PSEU|nr:hypothetical protein [Halosaccharopolyspora lacisalsi]